MEATDLHYCETYHCKMTVAACVSRYKNAMRGARGPDSYRAGSCDIFCKACAAGKNNYETLPETKLSEYKAGLRAVRLKAAKQTNRQYQPTPQPEESPMQPDSPTAQDTKVCGRPACHANGEPQPIENFYNDKNSADGKSCYCKRCQRELQKAYRKKKSTATATPSTSAQGSSQCQPVDEATGSNSGRCAGKPVAVAARIGAAAAARLAEHGDTVGNTGKILRVLYPDGIGPDSYDDMLAIARIVERLCCLAGDKQSLGEALFTDIAEAGLLGVIKNLAETEARQ